MQIEKGQVLIEVCKNQSGGYTLTISDNDGGHKLSPGKISGMPTVHSFVVDAKELIREAKIHGKIE